MTDAPNAHTVLAISGQGVAPYSARGVQQTLAPIAQATNSRRTVNGTLKDISEDVFKKYTTSLSCNDQKAPAFEKLWPGTIVTIDCVAELAYLTEGGSPGRDVVPGSSYVEGDYTYYRPRSDFMVLTWSAQEDEYGAQVSWNMTAEEV